METKSANYDSNHNINKAIDNEFINTMDINQINIDTDIDYTDNEIDVQIKNKMREKMITFVVGESQEEENTDIFINRNNDNKLYKNEEYNENNIIIKDDDNNNNNITTSSKINECLLIDDENINNIPVLSRIKSDKVVIIDEVVSKEKDIIDNNVVELKESTKEIVASSIGIEKDLVRIIFIHLIFFSSRLVS